MRFLQCGQLKTFEDSQARSIKTLASLGLSQGMTPTPNNTDYILIYLVWTLMTEDNV